jgi:Actinobacteria/chloroflexi VLRF1 release factor
VTAAARTIEIAPGRLPAWLAGFVERHGQFEVSLDGDAVRLLGEDQAEARVLVPFPPLCLANTVVESLLAHVGRDRRVGAILVRRGGFAVGVFDGSRLVASKVGSCYVQGKTKAGGWSQQRYARRRDNQSRKAYAEAAEEAARLLVPRSASLEAVVTGGDRTAIATVFGDHRLADLAALTVPRLYPVSDPRLRILQSFPKQFLAIEIQLNDLA